MCCARLKSILAVGMAIGAAIGAGRLSFAGEESAGQNPVSFYRQVRPILQRNCAGCHQPAKAGGKLVVTSYAATKTGGEQGPGFEPGKPDESLLVELISGDKPEMPKNAPALS